MVVGRYIENIFLDNYKEVTNWVTNVIHMILRVRQKIRPGRAFPRQSFKPRNKWGRNGRIKANAVC